jgi:hypothetical protein
MSTIREDPVMQIRQPGSWISPFLVLGLTAGCANSNAVGNEPGTPSPRASGQANDSTLEKTAGTIEPFLKNSFPGTFAGLVVDHAHRRMTIYRKPDRRLDTAVRARALHVDVAFHDARYSLRQMQILADRIIADQDYWRNHGVEIQVVGPKSDGSGVEVDTPQGTAPQQAALRLHYGTEAISVGKASVHAD